MCAPLRRIVSTLPSPVPRPGMDEKVKMTAAHTITGSQSETARELGIGPMIGSPERHAVREPCGNQGRSRRCEGSCSFAEDHWPRGREGGGGGSPESEDLPRRRNPSPSRKEDSCFDDSSLWPALRCSRARWPLRHSPCA